MARIGIDVGIDYALFIVTRYREGLHDGLDPDRATVRTIDTAGQAVLFAGATVIIAVLGMFSNGLAMIRGSATAIAIGVLMTMLVSVTLLPAILGFVGTNVDRLGLPHRRRGDGAGEGAGAGRRSIGYRWSRVIQRRRGPRWPWPPWCWFCWRRRCSASGSSSATPGNRPTSDTTRQAYGLLSDGFGDGFNGPFLLGAETPSGPPTWRCWRTRRTR